MNDDQKKVEETIEEYYRVFAKFRPRLIAKFNDIPLMFITDKKVISINTRLGFWLVFRLLMARLKKQNYARSTFTSRSVRFLNENLALVDGEVSRYTSDGKEIETFSFTYTMRKVNESWKIVVGVYP